MHRRRRLTIAAVVLACGLGVALTLAGLGDGQVPDLPTPPGQSEPSTTQTGPGSGPAPGPPAPDAPREEGLEAVPTFHAIGLTWRVDGGSSQAAAGVRFRQLPDGDWRDGMPLVFDARTDKPYGGEYRGSIVDLEQGREYEIELSLEGTDRRDTITTATRTDAVRIGRVVRLPRRSSQPVRITEGGRPDAYVLYTGPSEGRATVDGGSAPATVTIDASYVVVRGLRVRGGADGIVIRPGTHDVIVEGNDVSGWGRFAPDRGRRPDGTLYEAAHTRLWGEDRDAAIRCPGGRAGAVERITIQGNRLHHPRTAANSWSEPRPLSRNAHPLGPQGVDGQNCGGQWVVRYNDVVTDRNHAFNDAIGGGQNFSDKGFPYRDSDIYGNRIAGAWDEGIEAEGANRNVRIWGNHIDRTFVKVGVATTQVGPLYVFRNVADRSAKHRVRSSDARDRSGPFLKAGSRDGQFPGGGRIHVFNNTVLQRRRGRARLGSSPGIAESAGRAYGIVSRGNILLVPSPREYSVLYQTGRRASQGSTFDYDLYNGQVYVKGFTRPEPNGVAGRPTFDTRLAPFALAARSAGLDAGRHIPNFADRWTGRGPDVGAHERGTPLPLFGLAGWRAHVARRR